MDISAEDRAMLVRQATGLVVTMACVVVPILKRKRGEFDFESEPNPNQYRLRSDGEQPRQRTLEAIYHSSDVECISMIRMRRAPFFSLCNLFRTKGLLVDNAGVSIEEQVCMFLHVVGHNQRYRVVHHSFRRSIETVHRHFHQVLYAVGQLREDLIRPPSTNVNVKILGSPRWYPYLQVTSNTTVLLDVVHN